MKISFQWLQRYIDLDVKPEALLEVFPAIGLEVDAVEHTGLPPLEHVVVGEILTRDRHPDADKLSVCTVDVGETEPLTIVCGAPNCDAGIRVVVARVGAVLPGDFKIKQSKIRGIESSGMMCSAGELGIIIEERAGILELRLPCNIGDSVNDVFSGGDVVFDLELTANRGDCLSHIGVARELAAYYGKPLKLPEVKAEATCVDAPTGDSLIDALRVESEDCPHYMAWSIRGVTMGESPEWLRKDLEAVGLRPVNVVVDAVNWMMLETGQPMHAFGAKKIGGRSIIVRRAKSGEKITTLDEKERTLDDSMLVIADADKPLVVAGVMGSLDAEVDDATTDIVLESAYFDPASIRRTARALTISSDSSYRYERDVDPFFVEYAARRAVDLLVELTGGVLAGPAVCVGAPVGGPAIIEIEPAYVREILGFDVEDAALQSTWERLGFEVKVTPGAWTVTVPTCRREVLRPIDLVEEFIRLHGTDAIPSSPVQVDAVHRGDDPMVAFNQRAAGFLMARGGNECCHYTMRSGEEVEALWGEATTSAVALKNPLASDQGHLRPSLLPGLLDALQYNVHRSNDVRCLFEHGHVFRKGKQGVDELASVAFVLLAEPIERAWKTQESVDFFTVKHHAEEMARIAGIKLGERWSVIEDSSLWQAGHAAEVSTPMYCVNAGLVNLSTLKKRWGMKQLVFAGELCFNPKLLGKGKGPNQFESMSAFPPVSRDVSLIVDASCSAESVRRDIESAATKLAKGAFAVERVDLFDLYAGKGLPEGKKSFGFSLTFRAHDRTLKDGEVSKVFDAVCKKIAEKEGYALRDN